MRDAITAAALRKDEFAVWYRIRRPDGVIRWIETRGREVGDDGDWVGVSIDVTEHRRTEEALRESNTGSARPSVGSTPCSPTRRSASRSTTATCATSG